MPMKKLLFILLPFFSVIAMNNLDNQLAVAVRQNNLAQAQQLLQQGANPNFIYENKGYKTTPLHAAASRGNNEMIKLLLKFGANPNSYDYKNWTPLVRALANCSEKHSELTIDLLLKSGADPNAIQGESGTDNQLLSWAITYDCIHAARLLLQAGANPNIAHKRNTSSLDFAKSMLVLRYTKTENTPDIIKLLTKYNELDKAADTQPTNELLTKAIELGYSHIVKKLLSKLQLTQADLDQYNKLVHDLYKQTNYPNYKEMGKQLQGHALRHALARHVIQQTGYALDIELPRDIIHVIATYAQG
jgi:ankyrin repeat protein